MVEYSFPQLVGLIRFILGICSKQGLSVEDLESLTVRLFAAKDDGSIPIDLGLPKPNSWRVPMS